MIVLCVPLGETLLRTNHTTSGNCDKSWEDKVKDYAANQNLHSFHLARDGVDIWPQQYWKTGTTCPWYGRLQQGGAEDEPNFMMSVTKTMTGLAVARAVQLGYIDFNRKVVDYIKTDGRSLPPNALQITVEHCMNMMSGLEVGSRGQDPVSILSGPKAASPGEVYAYSSTDPTLMWFVIDAACPGGALNFLKSQVFGPLGITNFDWSLTGWVPSGGAGLSMTAKDMWTVGQLMLNGGVVNGQQFLPEHYVATAMSKAEHLGDYRYYWHHDAAGFAHSAGGGGQMIVIDPEKKMLLVTTGGSDELLKSLLWVLDDVLTCAK